MPKKKKPAYRDALEIVAAFIAAWIFYQLVGLALGTQMPVVSVVSESMYHNGIGFDGWWTARSGYYTEHGIGKQEFLSFLFANGLAQGDMLVTVKPDNLSVGDVVIYQPKNSKITIIHRIVGVAESGYVLKGDNNQREDPALVSKEQILGKAVAVAPLMGYPRILLFAFGI